VHRVHLILVPQNIPLLPFLSPHLLLPAHLAEATITSLCIAHSTKTAIIVDLPCAARWLNNTGRGNPPPTLSPLCASRGITATHFISRPHRLNTDTVFNRGRKNG